MNSAINLEILRGVQKDRGIMSKDIAREIGMSESTYSKKVHGISSFTADEIARVLQVLRATAQEVNLILFAGKLPLTQVRKR